jgi:glycerol-3-phosphate dehydrogenase (NAD(P)+)
VNGADFVLVVVASHFYRSMAQRLKTVLRPDQIIISATKGLEESTLKRMSEIAAEEMGAEILSRYVVLSGPNLSKEIMKGLHATAVAASQNMDAAAKVQKLLSYEAFRVYTHSDVIGVELGGTLKNVIALAAGIVDGLKLGDNAKSALMVRASVEMSRLATALGAEQATLMGLSGMGDMITTCSSPFSRNHQVGVKLAKGWSLEKILKSMKAVAEGVKTANATYRMAQSKHIDMPITEQVYKVLYEGKSPKEAMFDLMMRDPKSEKQV